MPEAGVSVVIPNWNGAALLPEALRSLEAQTLPPLETIVVDNGSTDGSVALLRERWPRVRVLELERNRGFGAAVNAGIAAARGELVALVNNDVELEPGWLAALVAPFESDPWLAAAAGKLLSFTSREVLEECGTDWAWDGTVRHIGEGERDDGRYDDLGEVFAVCAGAAVYSRAALAAVGGFDERFFAYIEDLDWCFRARLAGYRCRSVAPARAYHRRRATSEAAGLDLQRPYARNCWLTMLKCYPAAAARRHWRPILARQMRMPVYALAHGWLPSYLRALLDLVALVPYVLAQRAQIRRRGRPGPVPFPELPVSFRRSARSAP